jgi:hypothetical protein
MKILFIVGMAAQKSSQRRKRQFISHHRDMKSGTLFLVYIYDTDDNVMVSDGPFYEFSEAYAIMHEKLSSGYCSWVVTYNE